ncbi:AsnC family transcriptional regulator [Streptacidiphilus sp. N1-10]|uniref:AsnC family transcriptional regulator n=1 Tax=Streptacidiphilus jeojiensis TaxID=3229225 RepID=A0ABV6XWV4_9ACTN
MQESFSAVDEVDLALINALQVTPRASWAQLGKALAIDPATAARRWERLREVGLAWVTCVLGPALHTYFCMAYAEVACEPARLDAAGDFLARHGAVRYVYRLTGSHQLLVASSHRTPAEVSAHLAQVLAAAPGVRSYRAELRTVGFGESSRWRLRSLDAAQRGLLAGGAVDRRGGSAGQSPPALGSEGAYPELYQLLQEDGRMPFAQLARRSGVSEPTVRRRVKLLLDQRLLRLRCEVAQSVTGWPVTAVLWATVPPEQLDVAGRALTVLPDVRVCCALTGPRNLMLVVWLRTLDELPALEARIARQHGVVVVDRAVCLRTVKQMDRLLDADGRAVGFAPALLAPAAAQQGAEQEMGDTGLSPADPA